MLVEVPKVFNHFARASSAVETNYIGAHGLKSGKRSTDFRANKHSSCGFDCHLHHYGNSYSGAGHRASSGHDGSFTLE